MSISSALSNAYSGLTSMSRSAETISNNVSNALTEGYSRQEVSYAARVLAGNGVGVKIDGINRSVDVVLTTARRRADASTAGTTSIADANARISTLMGQPGDIDALATRMSAFADSLRSAQTAPDSEALQKNILTSVRNLAGNFNRISNETTRIRVDADANIARQVSIVNSSLKQIEGLNAEIRMFAMTGRSVAALEDQRQILVDKVNAIIPIRQTQVNTGEIALYTTGGEILLNGSARELGFSPTGMMTPDMTLASGALSGITLNGHPVPIGEDGAPLEGGSLAANFRIRDTIAPEFHQQLDAMARDLVERFQDPAVDPTLVPGAAGIFTDNGAAFNPVDEIGLAARLSVNSLVDPAQGGELWRLRDGLGALVPGYAGDSTHLLRLSDSLNALRPPSLNMGIISPMSAAGFAGEITSFWASETSRAQEDSAVNRGRQTALRTQELNATGVDTDREMQNLLLVEQAYSANARVISVIDGLMATLLEM
ncbi:MAG: flagellar hook-associated protein FlgK [Paracoccaceae bacterium]